MYRKRIKLNIKCFRRCYFLPLTKFVALTKILKDTFANCMLANFVNELHDLPLYFVRDVIQD